MRENTLTILVMNYLVQQLPIRGLSGYDVVQNYQPTHQGRPIGNSVIVYMTANKRYGSPRVAHASGTSLVSSVRTTRQYREATFKITSTIAAPDPLDMNAVTQGDVVGITAEILNSSDFITYLKRNNCGVLRISEVTNTPIENDFGQNEANYSFDVIITHSDMYVDGVPVISEYEYKVFPI